MIEQPTVLVLGAGASRPYGFPSGQELLNNLYEQILNININGNKNVDLLKECGFVESQISSFINTLKLAQPYSVDAFLEYRPDFLDLGKLAITIALIPREEEHRLFSHGVQQDHLYKYLFSIMNTHFNQFDNNKLSFITFNYDRSLEHFLFITLQNAHNRDSVECAEKLSKIPIIHVHGSLGALPWQSSDGKAYAPTDKPEELMKAASQIIVVSESKETSPEFEEAHNLLADAKKIYFLGFGYSEVNLRRLKIDALPDHLTHHPIDQGNGKVVITNMMGSSHDLGSARALDVMNKWKISLPNTDNNEVCLEFLHEHVTLQ